MFLMEGNLSLLNVPGPSLVLVRSLGVEAGGDKAVSSFGCGTMGGKLGGSCPELGPRKEVGGKIGAGSKSWPVGRVNPLGKLVWSRELCGSGDNGRPNEPLSLELREGTIILVVVIPPEEGTESLLIFSSRMLFPKKDLSICSLIQGRRVGGLKEV